MAISTDAGRMHLEGFARTAIGIWPWLAGLLLAASVTYAIANAAPPTAMSAGLCQTSSDPMLAYAVTTHRVPASFVPKGC
jgi:hypothetical protein